MASRYKRTQQGRLFKAIIVAGVAITMTAAALVNVPVAWFVFAVAAALSIITGWLLGSFTVEVTDEELTWHFGPGFWRKRLPLSEIRGVEATRTKWWYGWGIRLTPRGWLYNISGLDAVAVTKADGRTILIGTDSPAALVEALSRR